MVSKSLQLHRGFTLIELLVVIAIIGILASVVLASLNSARAKSRDSFRVTSAKEVEKALQLYWLENDATYPSTGGAWWGGPSGCFGAHGFDASGYIPGLVPNYMSVLPAEPRPNGGSRCFLYRSNGTDYKFMIHGAFETCTAGNCPLQDWRNQPTGSIYTPGAAGW